MSVDASTRMVPASFTQRAIGRAIDLAILSLLFALATNPFVEGDEIDAPPLLIGAIVFGMLAYEIIPVHLGGQTPGKVIARTRVVRASDGDRPTLRESFIRWGIVCAAWVLLTLAGIPALTVVALALLFLSALADPGGRSVLDKAAGTRVVRSSNVAAERAS